MPQADVPRTIWFVVFPGFELLDLSGALCAFNLAVDFYQAAYDIQIVSATGGMIRGSSGVEIKTVRPPSPNHLDTLMVVGAPTTISVSRWFGDGGRTVLISTPDDPRIIPPVAETIWMSYAA